MESEVYQTSLFADRDSPFAADSFTADFSPCRTYRYTLWRRWGSGTSFVQFIGLNPSTADEFVNDPTLRRCINFAKSWKFDALCMTNLFAFRSPKPKIMKAAAEPVGEDNDKWLLDIAGRCDLIVAAWGTHGAFLDRAATVTRLLAKDMKCLGISKRGFPLHPLYQPGSCKPKRFIINR